MTANERQVGGTHYKSEVQHWDFAADAGLGYFEGTITKYLARYRKKHGLQDLAKAEHYTEKLLELVGEGRWLKKVGPDAGVHALNFCSRNDIQGLQLIAIGLAVSWRGSFDLQDLRATIRALAREFEAAQSGGHPAPHGYVNQDQQK
jgi:hypothetical protein